MKTISIIAALTQGNAIIMGRKTFESTRKPLPNRCNIVVSTTLSATDGIYVCPNLSMAVEYARQRASQAFVIGGQSIFEQALPLADKLHVSVIKQAYAGDAWFPVIEQNAWNLMREEDKGPFVYKLFEKRANKENMQKKA